ncbi:response regulator [Treponema sp.]
MSERYVLCVDDETIMTENLKREITSLFPKLRLETASSGAQALRLMEKLSRDKADLAILITDESMPDMAGHELLHETRKIYPGAYGIILTGYEDFAAIAETINEAGIFSYLQKPWSQRNLALTLKRAMDMYDAELEVKDLKKELQHLNLAVIAAIENTSREDEPDTYNHVMRVASYSARIAIALDLPMKLVRKLYIYAPLHDIGKSGIPHDILAKPGKLSSEEFELVKSHVAIGAQLLKTMNIDPVARDLILYHHESWDGVGYLAELKGEQIPLVARIVAIADTLDAMISPKPYRKQFPLEEAISEIASQAGHRFDPAVVTAFLACIDDIKLIARGEANEVCKKHCLMF